MNPRNFLKKINKNCLCRKNAEKAEKWLKQNRHIKTMEEAWNKCPNDFWMNSAVIFAYNNQIFRSEKRDQLLFQARSWWTDALKISLKGKLSETISFKKGANLFRKEVKNPFKGV